MTDADAATPQADPPVSGAGDAPPRRKRGMRRRPDLSVLEERIGHRFADRDLLVQALTHVSATNGRAATSASSSSATGARAGGRGRALQRPARADEGDLSRRLSSLVRRESCATVANAWEVGPHLNLGGGEVHGGGRRNARSSPTSARRSWARSSSMPATTPPRR